MRQTPPPRAALGVGVDVGGSGVRATVFCAAVSATGARLLEPRESVERAADGTPLAERLADGLVAIGLGSEPPTVPVGIATPGLKTEDGRGIARARNVEAAPHLLDELAQRLAERPEAARFALPARLDSDALAALCGETVVASGRLLGERAALYLCPGSGVAEARLRDGAPSRLGGPRLADLPPTQGDGAFPDLEAEASLSGLVERWRDLRPAGAPQVEVAAAAGDADARAALVRFAAALVRVIELRAPELDAAPASTPLVVRTRRGTFFASAAVQELVVPRLAVAAEAAGLRLVDTHTPASPHAACAGALELALRARDPEGRP